ncbi:MAG: glycosyltransferase family 4 protein [Thermomicrobiales bacterium]
MSTDDTQQPSLLFVSQVTPALAGSDAAARAAAALAALAAPYRVTLLPAPHAGEAVQPLAPELAAPLERIVWPRGGAPLSSDERFDVVHIARLESAPAAAPWLATAGLRQLDLGPLTSRRAHSLARLARAQGHPEEAEHWLGVETAARQAEDEAPAHYARIFVASAEDMDALRERAPAQASITVLPATLPVPEFTLFPAPARGDYTLLFTGDLSKVENADAMLHFCSTILPRIQAGAHRPVRLRIIGEDAGPALQRLAGQAGVELIEPVEDLEPWYRDAHLAIAPLRAGAGPYLASLEALAMGRPLVASTIGAEGLNLEHGVHALLADDPAPFATATLRLLHSPALAQQVAEAGHRLFLEQHTRPVLERILAPAN